MLKQSLAMLSGAGLIQYLKIFTVVCNLRDNKYAKSPSSIESTETTSFLKWNLIILRENTLTPI